MSNSRGPKISRKIKRGKGIDTFDPIAGLLDEDRIGRVIWECLKDGDAEGVIEVIQTHLEAVKLIHACA